MQKTVLIIEQRSLIWIMGGDHIYIYHTICIYIYMLDSLRGAKQHPEHSELARSRLPCWEARHDFTAREMGSKAQALALTGSSILSSRGASIRHWMNLRPVDVNISVEPQQTCSGLLKMDPPSPRGVETTGRSAQLVQDGDQEGLQGEDQATSRVWGVEAHTLVLQIAQSRSYSSTL